MATNDFIGFASNGSANIMSQADYAAAAEQGDGVQPGMASSRLANKAWRQGANMAAALGLMISGQGENALDNGDLAGLQTSFENALKSFFTSDVVKTGTFTPAFVGGTTPGSFTYSIQTGRYYKIGNLCFVAISIEGKVVTVPVGNFNITGLPFLANDANQGLPVVFAQANSGVFDRPPIILRGLNNATCNLWGMTASINSLNSVKFDPAIAVNTTVGIRFSGVYRTV